MKISTRTALLIEKFQRVPAPHLQKFNTYMGACFLEKNFQYFIQESASQERFQLVSNPQNSILHRLIPTACMK